MIILKDCKFKNKRVLFYDSLSESLFCKKLMLFEHF